MKKILFYKLHQNDRGNAITLSFNSTGEEKDFLKRFLSEPIHLLNWRGEPLHGHGEMAYSAIIR